MPNNSYPKLRPVEVKQFYHQGQPVFYLRDPLELSPQYALVPAQLGPILAACDGQHSLDEIQKEASVAIGAYISSEHIKRLLSQLDEVYLLDNAHSKGAIAQALQIYRSAPFRPPALAGLSYPDEPEALRAEFESFLNNLPPVTPAVGGKGLFSPHIDYFRGGAVYAQVWKRAEKLAREAEVVVIFGTDHNSLLPGQITLTRQNYATPFGVLPTEQKVVDAIIEVVGEEHAFAEEIHHRREHSIELVATWLHFIRNGEACPIVPILTGSFQHYIYNGYSPTDEAYLNELIAAIKKATAGRKMLAVASGDLAHLGPAFGGPAIDQSGQTKIKADDETMLASLMAGNADDFFEIIRRERGERNVCGTAPFYLTLKLMGQVEGELTAYDCCLADEDGTSFVSVAGLVFG